MALMVTFPEQMCQVASTPAGIRLKGTCIHLMQPWRPGCESVLDV
jgi:hypothetical protein